MKKILTILLTVIMCVGMLPVSAAEHSGVKRMFVYDDAELPYSTPGGDWETFKDTDDGTKLEKVKMRDGHVMHMHGGEKGQRAQAGLIFAHFKNYDVQKYVMRLDLKVNEYGTFSCSTADAGPNPNWHYLTFFEIDKHGFINIGGKPTVYMPLGEFHNLAFVVDNTKHKFDFYFDEKYMATATYDEKYNWLVEFNFYLNGVIGGSDAYFDNFALYEADALQSKDAEREAFYHRYNEVISSSPLRNELEEKIGDYNLFALDAKYGCWGGKRHEMPYRLIQYIDTTMAPVRCTAEAMGAEVLYSPKETKVVTEDKTYTLTVGSKYIGGVKEAMPREVMLIDGVMYIPAKAFFSLFGTVFHDSTNEFYAIGKENFEKELDSYINAEEMYFYLVYYKPMPEEIIKDFNENINGAHPRIFYTKERVAEILEDVKTDPDMKAWYDEQIALADKSFGLPGIKLVPSTSKLNTAWSGDVNSFIYLAQAYLFTKDTKYANELWRALEYYIDNNPDQNHRRAYLNGSGLGSGIARAYDWCYDYFTPQQRKKIEDYVRTTVIEHWTRAFKELTGYSSASYAVKYARDNINCVIQSQYLAPVMAFFETDPEYYSECVTAAIRAIEYFLPNYAPDGGYYEGPPYWAYATENLANFYELLEMPLGTDYGYYDVFSINKTGAFPVYMQGATIGFNFSDGDRASLMNGISTAYYFAKKNGDKEFATILTNLMRSTGYAVGDRRYDPDFKAEEVSEYPLDGYFRNVEAGSMRERWNDTGANYLGYRGGENNAGHQQLDKGHFVFDALGERWAEDLGRDNYNYPGYFDYPQRYTYYVNRGEGHNVLLVNSKDRVDDQVHGVTVYKTGGETKAGGGYAVLDTSPVYYSEDVKSAKRGFMLTDFRKTAVIRDELVLNKNGCDIWWFMHTLADIEILEGGKEALLTQGNKQLMMRLDCTDPDARFEVTEPEHMSEKTKPEAQYITKLKNIKRLAINAKGNVGEFNLTVNMRGVQLSAQEEFDFLNHFEPIAEWTVSDDVKKTDGLSDIRVNGETIQGFSKTNTVYDYNIERDDPIPEISADALEGWRADVIQADTLPGTAIIKVINENNPADYYAVKVNIKVPLYIGLPENMLPLEIKNFEATPEGNGSDFAVNAFDNDFATRWAVEGNSQMLLDLGESKEIDAVSVSFYLGDERINYYTIEVSDDKKEWKKVFDGESTGTSSDYMTVFLDNAKGRYVRLCFERTSTGTWNSTNEIKVMQKQK